MRTRLLLALLFPLLAAPLGARADEPSFDLVTLSAQAGREVPNDLLTAVLAAEAEGPDPAQVADSVNRAMQRALALARGAPAVKARSGAYSTYPVMEKGRIARWRARQELRLESADFAAAGALIGKLQGELALSGVALTVSPEARRRAENALIGEAIAAFEERARIVRDALKAKGYRLRDLHIAGGGGVRPVPFAETRALAAASVAQPAIAPGSTQVLITVSGTIQLQ